MLKFFNIDGSGDIYVLWVLIGALVCLGLIAFIISRLYKKQGDDVPLVIPDDECCGAHDVCEKESLLASTDKIIYYNDEELDAYAGKRYDQYTENEEEELREVLLTLQESDVAGWLKSIQLRNIELPESIKEEAMFIVRERRHSSS